MSFYGNMAKLASEMITEYGRDMIMRTYTESGPSYSPVRTPVDVGLKGVFTKFKTSDVDGTLIKKEDKMVLIDSAVVPEKSASIIDGGNVYEIVDFDEIAPGTTSILYKLQARK